VRCAGRNPTSVDHFVMLATTRQQIVRSSAPVGDPCLHGAGQEKLAALWTAARRPLNIRVGVEGSASASLVDNRATSVGPADKRVPRRDGPAASASGRSPVTFRGIDASKRSWRGGKWRYSVPAIPTRPRGRLSSDAYTPSSANTSRPSDSNL